MLHPTACVYTKSNKNKSVIAYNTSIINLIREWRDKLRQVVNDSKKGSLFLKAVLEISLLCYCELNPTRWCGSLFLPLELAISEIFLCSHVFILNSICTDTIDFTGACSSFLDSPY